MPETPTYTYRISLRLRARQVPHLLRRALSHPGWVVENVRLLARRRGEAERAFSLEDYMAHRVTQAEAFAGLLGIGSDEYAAVCDVGWWPASVREADDDEFDGWDGTPELLRVLGAAVRLMRPTRMVEVGVARGLSSAVTLAAMRANGHGHLHSIDLPALVVDEKSFVGSAVPEDLRDRWTLELGPSRLLLERLLDRLGVIDVFVHDGDHTYPSQLEECRLAWDHLRPGGLLVIDDVWCTPAFFDFAREVGARPYVVMGAEVESALGLLGRPR